MHGEVQLCPSMAAPYTHPATSRLECPAGRGPACWCTILHCRSQKASKSDPACGRQLWLSEGFTPAGLSQAYPSIALDLSDTCDLSPLLLPGRPLVVTGTSSVCCLRTLSPANVTLAPELPWNHTGGKASPVFPILYVFLSFLFRHFSI